MLISPIIRGFVISFGFITAIGAQNIFVLRQGMSRSHVFATAFVCSLIDLLLISMGVFGLGVIINTSHTLMVVLKWITFCILFLYGCLSLNELRRNTSLKNEIIIPKQSLMTVIFSLLAVSLLNPHVYLDTLFLIGSIGAQCNNPLDKKLFVMGCCIASTTWFFALCFGASYFSDFLRKPIIWKCVHLFVAGIMFWMAISSCI